MSEPRRFKTRWVVALAIIASLAIPTAVLAAGGAFTDDDSSVFEADIEWLAGSGVTKGCNPPVNTQFCPEDSTTRGQMAAFMRRFAQYLDAEDGTPGQADNADSLDGFDSTDLVTQTQLDTALADRGAVTVSAAGFTGNAGDDVVYLGCAYNLTDNDALVAGPTIPAGVTITHLEATVLDGANPANATVNLVKSTSVPNTTATIATVSSSGSSGLQTLLVELATPEQVDSGEWFHVTFAQGAGPATNLICSVTLHYSTGGISLL